MVAAIFLGRKTDVSLMEGMEMKRDVKALAVSANLRTAAFTELLGLCANDPNFHPIIVQIADVIKQRRHAAANRP